MLDAVNLAVPDGRITALLGESGCGKSMIAAALTGRLPKVAHTTGDVRVNGTRGQDERQWRQLRGRTVGLVPQAGVTAFTETDTVGEQLRELERRHGRWTIDRACAAACYPVDAFDLYPHQHSGGQIQRAALAAALLPAPDVLIADEPTASLDTGLAYQVWRTLRGYADTGAAVLAITQDVSLLATLGVADRMVFMRDGRIAVEGSASEIRSLTDPYVQGFFLEIGH
nr:Dipeptide transport ATP-binding protein DppD (TC 3.A.1.5.2) [Kibdelosporangium sp. MJ126-NF4]